MKNLKLGLIIAAGVIAVILLCVFGVQSSQNKAFALEEQVNTAQSDIKVQEKRRVDLVYNLADCVKQYDKHEAETLKAIIDTIKESSHIRYKYYGIGTKYTGTIFTDLRNQTISENTKFYVDKNIEETVEYLETGCGVIIFWIFWIALIGGCVFGFYYLDNKWLE